MRNDPAWEQATPPQKRGDWLQGLQQCIHNSQREDSVYVNWRKNMEKPISSGLKTLFLVHAIVSLLFGLVFWLVPGRFLTLVGWIPQWTWGVENAAPVRVPGTIYMDPYFTRGLGAALLALAFASFRGWRAIHWSEVALVVELDIVFCLLGLIGMIATLIRSVEPMPAFGWVEIVALVGFCVAWLWAWRSHTRS
jgi:hypothetical protein